MNNMWGSLPPELYHIRYLKALFISDNEMLSGEIPFQYGWWKFLDARKLYSMLNVLHSRNMLEKWYQPHRLPLLFMYYPLHNSCNTVALTKNNLIGKIPHSFAYLTKLRTLRLEVRGNF